MAGAFRLRPFLSPHLWPLLVSFFAAGSNVELA